MKRVLNLKNWIYGVTLFFITLSGFAQMPIFKRYYIADIPGFGWLAKFYITHIMHYSFAIILIVLVTYTAVDYLFNKNTRAARLTKTAYFKIIMITGLIFSGSLMVLRNLPGIFLSHSTIIALDLIHLGLCMGLLAAVFYSWINKKEWYE